MNWFCEMVDRRKSFKAYFPAETIVTDSHHCNFPKHQMQDFNVEPDPRLCWMKLFSSGNLYTTVLSTPLIGSKWVSAVITDYL